MDEVEFKRLQNLLSTVIEQQATFAENQLKAEARMTRNEEALASLLGIVEIHEQEIAETNERIAETNERLNVLVGVVEKFISKDQQ